MTEFNHQELAPRIEAIISSVPGVTSVFRAGSLLSKVASVGAQLIGVEDEGAGLVNVDQSADGLSVEVAIGVDASFGAVETANLVQSEIRDREAEFGLSIDQVHVTVVLVETPLG